jgi:L-lactate utilization protein LutB
VVLLDNGRSNMLGTEFQDMLRCIRCGACMNHCPVYHAVGGHAYGWVYPGPMGAVLTPAADRRREGPSTCPTPRPSAAAARASARCAFRCPKMMRTGASANNNFEARVRLSPDARVSGLPWDKAPMVETSRGRSHGKDPTSVTPAVAAVAETGTMVLQSSEGTPTTLHFLPDQHVVVIAKSQIVGTYEDALARVKRDPDGGLPRTVNFVTGPSRSADIGKILLMGAHGPKKLHVIVVDEEL